MKIILTGATGFIGGEILTQCLENTSITSLVILSRRPIERVLSHSKAKIIIMENFKLYSESVIREIADADACIWALGTYDGNVEVEVDYPTAFAKAILQGRRGGGKFRYVHLGGAFTEEDQEKALWWLQAARKGRGLGEFKMKKFAKENGCEEYWETFIMKPGGVLKKDSVAFLNWAIPNCIIRGDECAASMIDVALNGAEQEIVKMDTMVLKGKSLLGR
ncbi:nucleoside-diphosphate-sugar epimeras-like protein [Amylocarpus encephaloides]|uniref:Nucleoside-diphosphate-sugar epimeras-like protein n=1 Tax=Amylocarpus encephaloides TaxID=45428 RepID=A0A9P7YH87_9HELO|nr:nucleoside-diphosphate-sugar epimeras-like protein [Amylocarpus encephaloides]